MKEEGTLKENFPLLQRLEYGRLLYSNGNRSSQFIRIKNTYSSRSSLNTFDRNLGIFHSGSSNLCVCNAYCVWCLT